MPKIVDVLKADPLKFLKAFPIKLGSVGASRLDPNVTYGQKRQASGKSVLYFFNSWTQYDDQARVETTDAHIVQAQHGAPNFYTLTDQCDFMITSELSGCCLILDRTTSPPGIAHVWPHTAVCQCGKSGVNVESGEQVQVRLAAQHPNCKLYGKKDYIQVYAYVVGVSRGGHWRFYAQERPNGGPIADAYEVLN
jgi:hypothetical protein